MSQKSVDEDSLQEALDLCAIHGSPYMAAKVCNIPMATLRDRRDIALKKGMTPTISPEDIASGQILTGTSTLYDATGKAKLTWIKTKEDQKHHFEVLKEMIESFKGDIPKVKPRNPIKQDYNKKLMSVIPWGDVHMGLYCWEDEVGADFDLDIAEADLITAVKYLVSQSPASERCVLINLGDFFHSDDGFTTTKGTRLDTDTRLAKVVRVGVNAIRTAIECALKRHKVVEIINASGNHDQVLSMCLKILLAHVYEKEPRVIVHDQPTPRHYLRHGKVLIGVVHGDKAGKNERDLPGIMAAEKPQDWGETTYRYWYKGHFHHDKKTEFNGATVEMFRTLAPNDEYATSGGWLSMQDMKLICHHSDYGEVKRVTLSLNMLRDLP